jgi:hypothetical protein
VIAQLPAGAEVFAKTYADFSHLTWIAGSQAAWDSWSADLFAAIGKYNT